MAVDFSQRISFCLTRITLHDTSKAREETVKSVLIQLTKKNSRDSCENQMFVKTEVLEI